MLQDPWKTLGVRRGAGPDEVRRAFRRRARELHPDRRPNDAGAEEEFKRLVDALRAVTLGGAVDGRGGEGARASGHRDRAATTVGQPAPDVAADFSVGLGDAVRGGEQAARLRFEVPCSCRTAPRGRRGGCPQCGGRGVRRIERRVVLRLPPGSRDGDLLRVGGVGADTGAGPRGDLRVRLRVRLPAGTRIVGDDLHVELPLTIPEAVIGARIPLPSPLGPVSVTVPAGSDGSSVLRVRGHGLPPPPGSNRPPGHLFLYPLVRLPPSPSAVHLRAVGALASAYPDDPRAGLLADLAASPRRS